MVDHHERLLGADIVNGTPYTFIDSTNPVDPIETKSGYNGDVFAITLVIMLTAPCLLACILQIIFRWKKRQQDRVEREILEVTTNPTSRRMVLDEILSGSSKQVEYPSNKRRVQVKKYRKKTPEERRLGCRSKDEEVASDNELPTDECANIDEEMGSVRGCMIICFSGKNAEEKDTSDDASASSMDSCESGIENTLLVKHCTVPNLVEEEERSATVTATDQINDQGSVKRISPNCLGGSLGAEEPASLAKLSIPDVGGNTSNALVALNPKLSPNPHYESEDEKKGEILHKSSNDLSLDVTDKLLTHSSFGLVITPIISDDEDSLGYEEKPIRRSSSIFRNETQGGAKIEPSSSTLTEVTSNVADTGVKADGIVLPSTDRIQQSSSDLSSGSDSDSRLKNTIPLTNVASTKSSKTDTSSKADTSSHISYFSFDDETIASDQAEMCAICICPYDEGDSRIFSKRCPHSFHKDCLFEWLVKGHDECPCCRTEMVSKLEVKEKSASLIGTERLAQALASTMVEAPPLRFRQARMARQMFARARQSRRRAGQDENETESSARQNTVNSHWLWNARFDMPSPDSSEQHASLPSVNETFPQGLGQSPTARNEVTPPAPLQTRSFDATMDPQPTEELATRSFDAITDSQQTSQVQTAARNNAAGNTRNFHNHWASWNNAQGTRTPRRSNSTLPPVATTNTLGRLRRSGSGSSSSEPLDVTVLPTI